MTDTAALESLYAGSIVQTVREPLLLLDEDMRVVMANESFCETFSTSREAVEGSLLQELEAGAWDSDALRLLLEDVIPHKGIVRDFKITETLPVPRTLLLSARRLAHADDGVRLILLAFEDVTERQRLQSALASTMAELERSNHELEAFASVASHDLQEPLRKIIAFGERLEAACGDGLPEQGRDYLARMTGAAARMQRLITDLLLLARVATCEQHWSLVALDTVVSDVLGDLEEALARSGGRVECGPLPGIRADPTQMRQLFQNLIGNALKFRGEAPPVVRITATRQALRPGDPPLNNEQRAWRIDVVDNGIGFDPKYAARIFRPFERLHPRGTFEGTGIGLALCQRIVQRHGGIIRAESEPGAGSRFIVSLPSPQEESS